MVSLSSQDTFNLIIVYTHILVILKDCSISFSTFKFWAFLLCGCEGPTDTTGHRTSPTGHHQMPRALGASFRRKEGPGRRSLSLPWMTVTGTRVLLEGVLSGTLITLVHFPEESFCLFYQKKESYQPIHR